VARGGKKRVPAKDWEVTRVPPTMRSREKKMSLIKEEMIDPARSQEKGHSSTQKRCERRKMRGGQQRAEGQWFCEE